MKVNLILILFIVVTNQLIGQPKEDSIKIITGYVYTDEGEPYIGLPIYEYGTINGTITQINGEFQLQIPANKQILISISFCFEQYFRFIKPEEKEIIIKLTRKEFKKSKKVFRKWQKQKNMEQNIEFKK